MTRSRRVVENLFGIVAARWRVVAKRMESGLETSRIVVMVAFLLHNFMIDHGTDATALADKEDPVTHAIQPGLWRQTLRRREDEGMRTIPEDVPAAVQGE